MPRTCQTCGAHTYRINSYYPEDSETICGDCNCEVQLCICKPLELVIQSEDEPVE